MFNKDRIKSTSINKKKFLTNKNLIKSISLIDETEVNIPNKLKKYLDEQPLKNSYIRKLSILLNSNDKNYKYKRSIIEKLSSAFDESNNEFLTGEKIIPYLSKSSILNQYKNRENEFPSFLNEHLEYYRSPQVIINNEKIILETFKKKKNKLIHKIPYLSRSRNDLIVFDYKRMKNKSFNSNEVSHSINNNNYISNYFQTPKMKKIIIKKVNSNSQKYRYDNNKVSSSPTRLYDNNNDRNKIKKSILLPLINKNSKSMIFESQSKNNYNILIKKNILKKKNYENNMEKTKEITSKIGTLSNKSLLKKLKNSVQKSHSTKNVIFTNIGKIFT